MLGDITDVIERHDRAIYNLQQLLFSSKGGGSNTFKSIIIDDGTTQIVLDLLSDKPADASITATPGAIFDRIYVDVEWASLGPGFYYQVDYAKKLGPGNYQIIDSLFVSGTSKRIENLDPDTDYGVRVWGYNPAGQPSIDPTWHDVTTVKDASIPTAVTGVLVGRGATSVIVKFNASADVDVAGGKGLYLVQISNDNFATVAAQTYTSATVVPFSDITGEGSYKARVYAIDSSGNQSAPSTSSAYTAGGVVDAMLVGNFDAGHIQFGSMSGDRISANTLDIVAVKSSSVTTATLTLAGGALRALNGTGGVGMLINSQGISIYNSSGTRTIFLDATTGAGTFAGTLSGATGTFAGSLSAATGSLGSLSLSGTLTMSGTGIFQTANSGTRITINNQNSGGTGYINFFSGLAGETVAGYIVVSAGDGAVTLQCPTFTGGFGVPQIRMDGANKTLTLTGDHITMSYNTLTQSSSKKIKRNIKPLRPSLDIISALKPSEFEWRDTDYHGFGLIAEEVQEILPDLVRPLTMEGGIPGPLGLDYIALIPFCIKAIQELRAAMPGQPVRN